MEVGDNYPRGIQTTSFKPTDKGQWSKTSKVFYQFKTKHSNAKEAKGYENCGGKKNASPF